LRGFPNILPSIILLLLLVAVPVPDWFNNYGLLLHVIAPELQGREVL